MAATLGSQERHSLGDLTLQILNFSSVAVSDTYALTNSPGIVGVWAAPWAGTGSGGINVRFSNSATGGTLEFVVTATATASVYVLSQG
jgi:hypothetical protein